MHMHVYNYSSMHRKMGRSQNTMSKLAINFLFTWKTYEEFTVDTKGIQTQIKIDCYR